MPGNQVILQHRPACKQKYDQLPGKILCPDIPTTMKDTGAKIPKTDAEITYF